MFMRILGAAAAALMLALAVPGAAAAVDGEVWSEGYGQYADGACDMRFEDYGEHFYLNDNLADGSGCFGQYVANAGVVEMYNSKGAGTTVHHNLDLPEGMTVSFQVCARDDGYVIIVTCSVWRHAVS
jgi:hypothetical protein